MPNKIGLLQGTFEIIHYGHIKTFEYAKSFCDNLIIALNTNDLIRSYKGREPIDTWENKKKVIESMRMVDKVIPANEFSPMQLLKENNIDVFICADEFMKDHAEVIKWMESNGKKVIISPRREGITSTSAIKKKLLEEYLLTLK